MYFVPHGVHGEVPLEGIEALRFRPTSVTQYEVGRWEKVGLGCVALQDRFEMQHWYTEGVVSPVVLFPVLFSSSLSGLFSLPKSS